MGQESMIQCKARAKNSFALYKTKTATKMVAVKIILRET